jgi:nitrite reductase/ring-hydroxylating ferredoxin subunit
MTTRRDFITGCGKVITGAALSGLILPVLQSCVPTSLPLTPLPPSLPVGADGRVIVDVSDLNVGNPIKSVPGLYGNDGLPILITRISDTDFRALSSYCPHAGCQVESTLRGTSIPCLCHNSLFALDGSVVQGPAVTGLKRYDTTYDATSHTLHIKVA